jgi:tetratricopeptide (TPR) repeat protein
LQIRAYGLVRGNHRQRAIQAYEEILARWPDNVTALRRLAAVQFTQSNTPEMLKLADRLIQIPSGAAIGYTLQGVVQHNDKNYEQAAAAFERVLELDPELRVMPLPRPLFWNHLADDLAGSGRLADVIRYLTRALEKAPDAELMYKLGRAYFLRGALDEAEQCYRQAAEWNPDDFRFHLHLGKVELQRKHFDTALKHLDKARALAPRQTDVLNSLSLVYRQLGRTTDADRLQKTINQWREQPAAPARSPHAPWPRHAL